MGCLFSGQWYRSCNGHTGYGYYLWTAGRRLVGTEHFVWRLRTKRPQYGESVDDEMESPMNYYHWSDGQPDNSGGREHCVNMWPNRDFTWNDQNCASEFCFVCEDRNHR